MIKAWDLSTGKELTSISTSGPVAGISLAANGARVAAWIDIKQAPEVDVYSTENGERVKQLNVHDSALACLAFGKDTDTVVVGDLGGAVRVWDLTQGERIGADLPAHASLGDIVLGPDRKTLITAGEDGEIKIWDLTRRGLRNSFKGHEGLINAFAITDDGSRFATACTRDKSIKLWETATGKELRRWTGVEAKGLCLSADGTRLVTANTNSTAYLLECP
jgi:WD40 repeat protein